MCILVIIILLGLKHGSLELFCHHFCFRISRWPCMCVCVCVCVFVCDNDEIFTAGFERRTHVLRCNCNADVLTKCTTESNVGKANAQNLETMFYAAYAI